MTYQKFNKDSVVFYQGDVGDSFYIIITGTLSVHVKPQEDTSRRRRTRHAEGGNTMQEKDTPCRRRTRTSPARSRFYEVKPNSEFGRILCPTA